MNISILASVGCQNLGDELILKNEIQLLRERYGQDTVFRVFSYDPQNPFLKDEYVSYREYFPVGIKDISNLGRNIKNAASFFVTLMWSDLIVIGGGGLFYETEVQSTRSPLDLWVYRMKWIRVLQKPVLFFGVGIDVQTELEIKKIQKIFSYKKAEITVRDMQSFFILNELGISAEVIDDPVFIDHDSESKGQILLIQSVKDFSPKNLPKYSLLGQRVGVALRQGYMTHAKSPELEILMIEEFLSLLEEKGAHIVLLPHSFHQSDSKANDYVFLEKFLKESREIKTTMAEVYEVYTGKQIDICIAMRLHSIILSYVYGIQIIALSYSQKTDQVLKKLSK